MAKKRPNAVVMASKLYSLAEDETISELCAQFGIKTDDEKYKKVFQMLKSYLRKFLMRLDNNGVLDQSLLLSIGVLVDDEE